MSTKKTATTKTKTKKPIVGALGRLVERHNDELGRLIDRHGDDCGYLMYSPYSTAQTILCLSDDGPRWITLKTWERWGKQAKSFHKSVESALKAEKVVKKKTKKVTKKVAKKVAKKK